MYSWGIIHIIIATLFTYFFMKFFGRKISAFYVLGFTITHLSFLHIYRMYIDMGGWKIDVSTIYMMSICKFTSIAFCYEDGGKEEQEIKDKYHRDK
jgi:lysophospholipid acyltransferase